MSVGIGVSLVRMGGVLSKPRPLGEGGYRFATSRMAAEKRRKGQKI